MVGDDDEDFDIEERPGLRGTLGLVGFAAVLAAGLAGLWLHQPPQFSTRAAGFVLLVYGALWLCLGTRRFAWFVIPLVDRSPREGIFDFDYEAPGVETALWLRRAPGLVVAALLALAVFFIARH